MIQSVHGSRQYDIYPLVVLAKIYATEVNFGGSRDNEQPIILNVPGPYSISVQS